MRLLIVPGALAGVLFPAVSAAYGTGAPGAIAERLALTSLRYITAILAPVVMLLIVFAGPVLRLWLGPEYAVQGAPAFAILAAGVFINSLAFVPSAYLYGRGRPDLPAKFHMGELVLYVLAGWLLIRNFGITGAALAWTLRVTVDTALLGIAMWRVSARELRRAHP